MTVPTTMRAAFIRTLGPAEAIEYGRLPTPLLGAMDVLVHMKATAVNHVDLFVRSGAYRTHTPFPFVIGRDLVGVVVAVGPGVGDTFAIGEWVWTNSLGHAGRQGSFAEYAAVASDRLYHLPTGVDPIAAVSVLHTAATAHLGLFSKARLSAGETVYVSGAGGGVGTSVIQLAHAAGARVIASAATRDRDRCLLAGAAQVLDRADPRLYDAIGGAAEGGVDVWWDNTGRNNLTAALPLMRTGGRVVISAGMNATPVLPTGLLYTREVSLLGLAISLASVGDLARAARTINTLLMTRPPIGRVGSTMPLVEARRAHKLMEAGHRRGRIVVVP